MIMATDKGLKKDPDLAKKIDAAVFPGVQGGPHMENVAALCVALAEASTEEFKGYSRQVVRNAKALAMYLAGSNYHLIGAGTENHMVWIDLTNKGVDGWAAAWGLEYAGIIANRQTVPGEKKSPYYPSGLRLGTPAVTTRGMKEAEMQAIGKWIDLVIQRLASSVQGKYADIGSEEREKDQGARKRFKEEMKDDPVLKKIAGQVSDLCKKFPVE
jgi:glycine hydroxymethyltransferase